MSKVYQSEILQELVEEKERLTNTIANWEEHLSKITNNGTVTKEELQKKQTRCDKTVNGMYWGEFTSLAVAITTLVSAFCTLSYPILPFVLAGIAFLLTVSGVGFLVTTPLKEQKSRELSGEIKHLEEAERELEYAKTSLEKVVNQLQTLSNSDKELVALEEKQRKAQAMLTSFIDNANKNTNNKELDEEVDNNDLEDQR